MIEQNNLRNRAGELGREIESMPLNRAENAGGWLARTENNDPKYKIMLSMVAKVMKAVSSLNNAGHQSAAQNIKDELAAVLSGNINS